MNNFFQSANCAKNLILERKKFYTTALLKGEAMVLSGNGWEQKLKFLLRDEKRGEIK